MRLKLQIFLILAAVGLALALRLPRLEQRPMHTDEAVHAVKFGALLEKNTYRYDPHEYHGPTLNYLTLIPAWLTGETKFTEITEKTLRLVPVCFGVLLICLLPFLRGGLGWTAIIVAAFLTAASPAMAFYSRYYIQEMLLVCFTFGAIAFGYRFVRNPSVMWAAGTGLSLGLMFATKETSVIAFGAMALALLVILFFYRRESAEGLSLIKTSRPKLVLVAVCSGLAVSALFYSSFFSNPAGALDSVLAFKTYFNRAGQNELHIHPWPFYLQTLFYAKYGNGPVWSEALILVLALVGFAAAFLKKQAAEFDIRLVRFIAVYTLIMTLIYSAIPYKTPWNMLSFLHGMILLAGVGTAVIFSALKSHALRGLAIGLLVIGIGHLTWQAVLANFKYAADSNNPYVYAHTGTDIFAVVERVNELARVSPDSQDMKIDVIFPDNDYWPLPWYLRAYKHVGWWNKVDENTPAAPVIIALAAVEQNLVRKLYELPPPGKKYLYLPMFDAYMELRPRVEIRGYVRKDLWDRWFNQ